ncbi:MAG TPA: hypothetical protein VN887_04355 [Candidatus Angelobacter sp.]|nr:hypothetical protein [Candidatus Angelobacter sp.]
MKTLFAILLSVLLPGAQVVFTADARCPVQPAKARCACPHCPKAGCCVTRSAPAPKPLSVPPVQGGSHQPLLTPAAEFQLIGPSPAVTQTASLFFATLPGAAVPLYQRNCSFLL